MGSKLISVLGLFCISWLCFAIIDFKADKNTLRVYQLKEVLDRTSIFSGKQLPAYSAEAVHEYKVSGHTVISKLGPFVHKYDDCIVFNVNNWICTFSDDSATFGAEDGVYFSYPNLTKFPHLSNPIYKEGISVSRWNVILNHCEWYFLSGWFEGMLGCAIAPFITE